MTSINALIRFLDRQLRYCDTFDNPKVAYDQAFGGVQLFLELFPDNVTEKKVAELWDSYRPLFDKKVYGV